jgi:hypothetical protein
MSSILLIILCLSLVTPAEAWICGTKITKSQQRTLALHFVPSAHSEDLLRVGHRDEFEDLVLIHKDTDDAEKYFEDAQLEFEELLGGVKNNKPFFGAFDLEETKAPRMRTPREDHFLMTALDSWKKISNDIDDGCPNELHWEDWPLQGI